MIDWHLVQSSKRPKEKTRTFWQVTKTRLRVSKIALRKNS